MKMQIELPPAKRQCGTQPERIPNAEAIESSINDISENVELSEFDKIKRRNLLTACAYNPETIEDLEDRTCSFMQYHCDACNKDITKLFRISCGECPDFDLCVNCFTSGVEIGNHKNDHSYIPVGRNNFSIFTPDWNADEEVMLLEGVSKFGFGNWPEIASLIAPYSDRLKRRKECEEHYYSVHIKPYCEEPKTQHVKTENEEISAKELQKIMLGSYYHPAPPKSSGNAACNVVGYMPLRGDFDVEYDNDAEVIISDLEFRGDETPQERELKFKVLDIYNARIDERILRKRIVIEKGLVDWRRAQRLGRRRMKEENDFYNMFWLLIRYNMEPDYNNLAELFISERKLRHRIRMINEWKSLGLKTFKEVENYEKMKALSMGGTVSASDISKTVKRVQPKKIEPQSELLESDQKTCQLEGPASTYPGASLLTTQELQFCDTLQIPPVYFLLIKHTLIKSFIKSSNPQFIHDTSALRLDASRQGNLCDFLLHAKLNLPLIPQMNEEK